jgi:hypothetical protein
LSQDRHRGGVAPARFQDFSSELLGLGELPLAQRDGGAFERLASRMLVSATSGRERRMLRHDSYR